MTTLATLAAAAALMTGGFDFEVRQGAAGEAFSAAGLGEVVVRGRLEACAAGPRTLRLKAWGDGPFAAGATLFADVAADGSLPRLRRPAGDAGRGVDALKGLAFALELAGAAPGAVVPSPDGPARVGIGSFAVDGTTLRLQGDSFAARGAGLEQLALVAAWSAGPASGTYAVTLEATGGAPDCDDALAAALATVPERWQRSADEASARASAVAARAEALRGESLAALLEPATDRERTAERAGLALSLLEADPSRISEATGALARFRAARRDDGVLHVAGILAALGTEEAQRAVTDTLATPLPEGMREQLLRNLVLTPRGTPDSARAVLAIAAAEAPRAGGVRDAAFLAAGALAGGSRDDAVIREAGALFAKHCDQHGDEALVASCDAARKNLFQAEPADAAAARDAGL